MIHHSGWRRTLAGAGTATVLVAGAAACTGGEQPADAGDAAPDQITYVTNFGQLGRDAYAYVALEKGFFAQANLDVTIEPGRGTNPNLVALLSGQAQFTAIDMAGAITAHRNTIGEEDSQVVADGYVGLAAIHQQPLAAVMAYEDARISSPLDLEGKAIGLPSGAVTELLFPAYADLAGIDLSRVEQVALEPTALVPALASGQVDAIGQFVVGRGLVAAAGDGREVVVLPYSEYLADLYGVVLFTTTGLAASDPELCVRVRDALLRGLAYSMEHPDEAGEILTRHNPEMAPEVAAAEMAAMVPYTQVLDADRELGDLDESKVMRGIAVMQAIGLAEAGLQPADLVAWDLTLRGTNQ
jgi:NitT/TauT family transport system substrate-binding protein